MPTNNYGNIPLELRELKQWCVWKKVIKPDGLLNKIPFQANGEAAKSNDPATWITFEQALACSPVYDGIGFILSKNDPYALIDLDDKHNNNDAETTARQMKILKEFDSYSERSPSRTGCHIIVKGSIPHGRNKSSIEIYSSERFMTMTGDIWTIKPIAERHDLLNQLFNQMGGASIYVNEIDKDQIQTDEEILELAFKYNSEKFIPLSQGEWKSNYPSQSEADLAYMNIISHYTDNQDQVKRIYVKSELAKTDAKRKSSYYLNRTVKLAFDQKLPTIDINGFDEVQEKLNGHHILATSDNGSPAAFDAVSLGSSPNVAANNKDVSPSGLRPAAHNSPIAGSNPATSTIIFPPGLLGEIAQFIYDAAPRPVKEMALAGAIGLMSGICGKPYNISRTGLNHYMLLLAPTGTGKEQMASGISKLISAAKLQVPVAGEFIGPSAIASSQGLHKWLSKNSQCFVSILGEFGLRLEAMSNAKANVNQIQLKECLLDLFNKSGKTDCYGSSAYSDQDKNSLVINAPAFSILGESTPDRFYPVLTEEMIGEGLLPRFSIIEYDGIRVASNKNPIDPPDDLVNKLSILMGHSKILMRTQKVIDVIQDDEALKLSDQIDKYSDNQVNFANKFNKNVVSHLWSRAHLKVLKLAGLAAVGIDPANPIVTKDAIEWAWDIVQNDIRLLSHKFESGLVGKNTEELKQSDEMERIVKEYLEKDFSYVAKYLAKEQLHKNKIICNTYLNNRLGKLAVYRNDRLGASIALKRTIQLFVDNGRLTLMTGPKFVEKAGTTTKCWLINLN